MNKKKKKKETIEDICHEFKKNMQRIVDRKRPGISKITLTFKGDEEIVIAERRRK